VTSSDCCAIVEAFDPGADGLAAKSRALTLDLLRHTDAPFSRHQFTPGHLTCTALVMHPGESKVLFMYHRRLNRWLLPGGHVEPDDPAPQAAAAREAMEETRVDIDPQAGSWLAGIDVHGIPPRRSSHAEGRCERPEKHEPFHLHHDLIWRFRAASDDIAATDEAPRVRWAAESDWDSMDLADSIRNSVMRAFLVATNT